MTQILTFRYSTNTENEMALISVVQTTANVYASSEVTDDYSDDAVKRILKAKDAKPVPAPDDAAGFMSWLTA